MRLPRGFRLHAGYCTVQVSARQGFSTVVVATWPSDDCVAGLDACARAALRWLHITMGKNKKPAAEVVAAALPPGASASWFPSGRQRRKCGKCIFWLLIPLAAAAGLAYLAPPPPPEKSVGSFKQSSNIEDSDSVEEVGETPEAPPSDIWANPSECVAWSGSGQCKANPQFMLVNCAFSCAKLEYAKARYYKRCPIPDNYTAALAPGKMRGTFDRILRDFPELEPEEISHE